MQPPVQETDAGTVILPPAYNPEWSTAGSLPATSGSYLTNSEKSLTPSGPNSATSALTPLAPWKEPYVTGTYVQPGAQPLSAVTPDTGGRPPFYALPPGASPAQPPSSTDGTATTVSEKPWGQ